MFKWLRGLREETRPIAADANRIVARLSEWANPRATTWTRLQSLSASSARLMTIDAPATVLALLEQARVASAGVGLGEGDEGK